MPIDIIEPIFQKDGGDCGLAAVAMLLGKPYREVSEMALKVFRRPVHKEGMDNRQIKALCKKFGIDLCTTTLNRHMDLSDDSGILAISKKNPHYAVLFEGVVVDPANSLLYTPESYLASHKGSRFTSLLILKEDCPLHRKQ